VGSKNPWLLNRTAPRGAVMRTREREVSESTSARGWGAGGGWEVEAQASFTSCISGVPHRADIARKALIVTAGFPKYEALRGFRCVPQCVVCQINAVAGRRTHGPCVPTNV
jgi:hypothetical protein